MAPAPGVPPLTRPIIMYPTWATDEYASIRFRFDCATAASLPRVSVTAASDHRSGAQSGGAGRTAPRNNRMTAAKAAAFEAVAIMVVTVVGAPWYTSGTHMWNGAAEILKPSPTSMSASPTRNSASLAPPPPAAAVIRAKLVLPVAPYVS